MTLRNTLLLAVNDWDLCLDSAGNIAMAASPYATAQDVASSIKLFAGELWYDDSLGVPYFAEILGHTPPAVLFEQYMVDAALLVPGVVTARCTIQSIDARTLSGQVLFVDETGAQNGVTL